MSNDTRGLQQRWALVAPHRPHLVAIARRRCASDEDAEDVVQEAMLRVAAFDKLDPARVGALLTSVTTRLAVDLHRARARAERYQARLLHVPGHDAPPDEGALDASEAVWLATQMQNLPERERDVLRERIAGYSVGETASRLGLTYKSAESAFTRARGRMRAWATLGALWAIEYVRRLRQRSGAVWASMAMVSAGCLILSTFPGRQGAGAGHKPPGEPPALALRTTSTQPAERHSAPGNPAPDRSTPSAAMAHATQSATGGATSPRSHVVLETQVPAPGGNDVGLHVSQKSSSGSFTDDAMACITGSVDAASRLDTWGLGCPSPQ